MKTPPIPILRGSLLLLLLGALAPLAAREFPVGDSVALARALATAGAGDVVVLRRGTWTDTALEVARGGSAAQPLIIRAEVPGEVILNGTSRLALNAPHVVVDGLFFLDGAIAKGAVVEFNSHHGVVRNVAIVDYNPRSFDTRYYWVFFNGSDNLLERCYCKGKNNLEPLIGNAIEGSQRNAVRGCYFKNIPYADPNGREIIRVWGAGKFDAAADGGAYFTIEGNRFDHADGEGVEIISLKSNHNQVLNNTLVATRGGINIRQGSHNLIARNVLLGEGVAGAAGLRMSGLSNTVKSNYVSGCDYGIRVSTGEYVGAALTPDYRPNLKPQAKGGKTVDGRIATYPQVKDLTLEDNVVVNVSGADLEIGFAYKRHWPEQQMVLLPEACLIRNNRFVRPHGGSSVIGTVPEPAAPFAQFKFAPNRFEGNRLVGGENTYAPAAAGIVREPLPADWTEAQERRRFEVLGPEDVGPAWVIAFRRAGKFEVENRDSSTAPSAKKTKPNKRSES